jgi:glycosyltransferase involved in cell wall biosynthesis
MISIISPVFNEELNVENCAARLRDVMHLQCPGIAYEHIFADNCSTDSTVDILRSMAAVDSNIKVIVNSRNVGPFRNMWNALKSTSGSAVIPFLPADLQDPVEVIPKFIEGWNEGYLVVYGVRRNRQENLPMRIARNVYYRIISKFSEAEIPKNVGEFLIADRKVINSILEVDDAYPYIRGLIAQSGIRAKQIEYTWKKRENGKSKLNLFHLVDQAINGFVSTSRIPARIALILGFISSFVGIAGAFITLALIAFGNQEITPGIPTIIVSIFFFAGLQLLFLGVIGEYVLSIHGQVRRTPPMFEVERINFPS